jgi:hypothetical protein
MHTIIELNVLLRARAELPFGLMPATDEFRDGWKFVRSGGARRLEKQIGVLGWHFIRIADASLRSGVGETPQRAIASALKLALRNINEHFNGVEVGRIQLTRYPWFVLARVAAHPFRIQKSEVLPVPDDAPPLPAMARKRCPMPMLRQMLVEHQILRTGAQRMS